MVVLSWVVVLGGRNGGVDRDEGEHDVGVRFLLLVVV